MLAHAAETGKKLKPDVIATLTNARDANARGAWTKALGIVRDTLPSSEDERRKALQLSVPLDPAQEWSDKIKTYQDIRTYAKDVQQMNLMFYGAITAYLLPILYALLGACAYALRSLSQQIRARTYTATCADFARIIIAVIAGLVVGLFNNFTQGISLSPLAVAFLVGYGVEIFFSFLDTFLETLRKVRSRQLPQRA